VNLADRFDVRTLAGNAAYPSVLRDAGIEDAEMLVAVTQSDQTNLVACKIARNLFHVPTRLARLRSPDFLSDELLSDNNFAVDYAICPEQDITDYIIKLIEFPEALQVLEETSALEWRPHWKESTRSNYSKQIRSEPDRLPRGFQTPSFCVARRPTKRF
jgi:Trk K+ transport system NAD-binding subunit